MTVVQFPTVNFIVDFHRFHITIFLGMLWNLKFMWWFAYIAASDQDEATGSFK